MFFARYFKVRRGKELGRGRERDKRQMGPQREIKNVL